jgi:hypothetical protein
VPPVRRTTPPSALLESFRRPLRARSCENASSREMPDKFFWNLHLRHRASPMSCRRCSTSVRHVDAVSLAQAHASEKRANAAAAATS